MRKVPQANWWGVAGVTSVRDTASRSRDASVRPALLRPARGGGSTGEVETPVQKALRVRAGQPREAWPWLGSSPTTPRPWCLVCTRSSSKWMAARLGSPPASHRPWASARTFWSRGSHHRARICTDATPRLTQCGGGAECWPGCQWSSRSGAQRLAMPPLWYKRATMSSTSFSYSLHSLAYARAVTNSDPPLYRLQSLQRVQVQLYSTTRRDFVM